MAAGIVEGYGTSIPKVNYNTPDFRMLNELSYNVGVFSIFKNHDQIKATVNLLKDKDGKLRSKEDFIKEAQKLSDKYNKRYLATEYDQAVGAARMAKKWQDIERTRDLYPNLKYVAVMDERTRELHKNWHGIILPIDHPFWKTHYPPNDWGCRCTVRRTDKAVDDKGLNVDDMPNLPKQFNMNVGQTGKVFNNDHPYFQVKEFKTVADLALRSLLRFQTTTYFKDIKGTFKRPLNSVLGNINVNNKALKEALSQPHGEAYLKNNLVLKLNQVLKDAIYLGTANPKRAGDYYLKYHYLQVKDYDNMFVIVREDPKGDYFFYSIVDKVKL